MPLFGPKPNKIFVFIHYEINPPTSSQQAEIMASLPKASAPYIFAEAVQLPKEEYEHALRLPKFYEKWEVAYSEMVASRYLYNHAIGTYSKKVEYKNREMGDFLVTTASGVFGPGSSTEKEYVICPACGAGYNTEMVLTSILMKSPFMADMVNWNTRVTCRNCQNEMWVKGSYKKVFGQPRPKV